MDRWVESEYGLKRNLGDCRYLVEDVLEVWAVVVEPIPVDRSRLVMAWWAEQIPVDHSNLVLVV